MQAEKAIDYCFEMGQGDIAVFDFSPREFIRCSISNKQKTMVVIDTDRKNERVRLSDTFISDSEKMRYAIPCHASRLFITAVGCLSVVFE